jgi:release factor glutamine methyltransferase
MSARGSWQAPLAEQASWLDLIVSATPRLLSRREAQWIAEQASGGDLDSAPTKVAAAHFELMVTRRAAGEPLQYVLGSWSFRALDLWVDGRVLIPRPETEQVVERAVTAARSLIDAGRVLRIADLGTGSGAIALSLAHELPLGRAEIWATDVSEGALAVARANLAGLGRRGASVRVVQGEWLAALPADVRGTFDLIVSNPPYVADDEVLPADVAQWEPASALYAGPTGLEAIEHIVREAAAWLAPHGVLVVEIGATQGDAVAALARAAGFTDVTIHQDLAARDRILIASRHL